MPLATRWEVRDAVDQAWHDQAWHAIRKIAQANTLPK